MSKIEGSIPRDAIRVAIIDGGAAGDHTVTGIKVRDDLVAVIRHVDDGAISDLTSEFSISAADTLNNASGTATTDNQLLVLYLSFS